ncbi:hypothetical protein GCM10027051_13150 [Niabella terrae]
MSGEFKQVFISIARISAFELEVMDAVKMTMYNFYSSHTSCFEAVLSLAKHKSLSKKFWNGYTFWSDDYLVQ